MVARVLVALLATVFLVGCGGSSDSSTSSAPVKFHLQSGAPWVPVKNQAEGESLCDEWQANGPPDELAKYKQITFDVPHTGSDVTCVLA